MRLNGPTAVLATLTLALLPLGLLAPSTAAAQEADPQLVLLDRPRAFAEDRTFETVTTVGYSLMQGAGDSRDRLLFGFTSRVSMVNWTLALNFQVPLHYRPLALERNAFNEVSDFFAALDRLRYGDKGEGAAFFHLGRLTRGDARIGYGHIVDHYHSIIDFDSPQIGLLFDLDFDGVGFESFVNSFTHWDAMAMRGFVRPFVLSNGPPLPVTDTEIGVTIAVDWTAPRSLLLEPGGAVRLDNKRNPLAQTTDLILASADVTVPLVYDTWVEFRPFVAAATIANHGAALFAGVDLRWYVPIWDSRPLDLRLEYHRLGRGFIPFYFDTFYLVERFAFPSPDATTTKLAYLGSAARATSGIGVTLRWGIEKLFTLQARYADYITSPGEKLGRLILHLRMLDDSGLPFHVAVTYAKRGVSSLARAFELDESAMLLFQFVLQPFDDVPLRLGVSVERGWRVDTSTGRYGSATAITPYVAYAYQFD